MMEREYPDGTFPLADMEREELGPEWVAAMYESYAADNEAVERRNVPDQMSSDFYARTAHRLAERIERDHWERCYECRHL